MRKFTSIALLCAAVGGFAASAAQAEPLGAASRFGAGGEHRLLAGQRGLVTDGEGRVTAGSAGGFSTDSGAQGLRTRKFNRSADGSVTASGQGSASGTNGSAARNGSFTRSADGSASGERSTSVTNANTGVTFDGSSGYSNGSGFSRSATCTDAAGNNVSCGPR